MKRSLASLIFALIAVILLHDLSMAVVGHAGMSVSDHEESHASHQETTAPEDCGAVRLVSQRLPAPEPLMSDVFHSATIATHLLAFSAISKPFLVVPITPPPSACLALFQVFRL